MRRAARDGAIPGHPRAGRLFGPCPVAERAANGALLPGRNPSLDFPHSRAPLAGRGDALLPQEPAMLLNEDVIIGRKDAEALALMLGDRLGQERFSGERAQALMQVLQVADIVANDELPAERVAMGDEVTFVDEADANEERITLAFPNATTGTGRVSVLSPVGAALLGRSVGDVVTVALPNGRSRTFTITQVSRGGFADAEHGLAAYA
jgi:regulator of nucleoside diphosphate kinase